MKKKYKWNKEKVYSERAAIHELVNLEPKFIYTSQELIEYASSLTSIPVEVIMGNCRLSEVVITRYSIAWILRYKFKHRLHNVGQILGKHHTTIIHGMSEIDSWHKYKNQYDKHNLIFNHIVDRCIFFDESNPEATKKELSNRIIQTLDKVEQYREMINSMTELNRLEAINIAENGI